MYHHQPVQLFNLGNWFKKTASSVGRVTTQAVHTVSHEATKISHAVTQNQNAGIRAQNKRDRDVITGFKDVGSDIQDHHDIGRTITCGADIGIHRVTKNFDKTNKLNLPSMPTPEDTSICGCNLKSEHIIQRVEGSKQKVKSYAYQTLRKAVKCNTISKLDQYGDLLEKNLMNEPVSSQKWKALSLMTGGYNKKIRTQLIDGLYRSNVGLGKCYGNKHVKSLNDLCYGLQQNFPSPICTSTSRCCHTLLKNACQ